MPQKLRYEDLEKRVIELEAKIAQYKIEASSNISSVLLDIFRHIARFNTFKQTASYIFDQCKKMTGARSGYIALLSKDGKENEVLFLDAGGMPCDVDPELPMPVRGLRQIAYQTREVAYENAFADSPWIKFMPKGHVRLDNVLFAPLNVENKTVGVIGIANKPGGFNSQDVYLTGMLGDIAALALSHSSFQDSLKENEKRYQAILKTTTDGFWLTNTKGRLLEVNETYCRMSGYTRDELLSLKIKDLEAVEDSSRVADHTQRIIQKKYDRFESRHRRKDGSVYDVEVSAHFFQEESGHFI